MRDSTAAFSSRSRRRASIAGRSARSSRRSARTAASSRARRPPKSHGYRPCLRCRPELAPGNASVDATTRLAQAAASLIEDGTLDNDGTGCARGAARHHRPAPAPRVRRRVRRLAGGIRADAAAAAREASADRHCAAGHRGRVRERLRQRAAFQRAVQAALPPAARASCARACARTRGAAAADVLKFELSFRPPFDWPAMSAFLGARAIAGVEAVDGRLLSPHGAHRRRRQGASRLDRSRAVAEEADAARRGLRVARAGAAAGALAREGADGSGVQSRPKWRRRWARSRSASRPARSRRVRRFRDGGARDPRPAGDGRRRAHARGPLRRGVRRSDRDAVRCAHDSCFRLPRASPMSRRTDRAPRHARRARAHARRARARGGGRTARSRCRTPTSRRRSSALRALPGVGEWTAQYIAMRALAWPDAFPHTDLGV